jgi:hypothetical protein
MAAVLAAYCRQDRGNAQTPTDSTRSRKKRKVLGSKSLTVREARKKIMAAEKVG